MKDRGHSSPDGPALRRYARVPRFAWSGHCTVNREFTTESSDVRNGNHNQSLAVSSESHGIFWDISRRLCLALLTADLFCLHVQTENCIHTVLEFDTDYRNRLPVFSRDERDSQTVRIVLASLMIRICSYTKKCERIRFNIQWTSRLQYRIYM